MTLVECVGDGIMRCKSCGGELLFQNGIYLCNSCGATFALDSIYENIDVCICYEENDTAGRRTKDSIIAQEVYRKLEESKIATFYERISADGMTGNDLETGKLAAIHKAKAIIVLGTSVENFNAIETKYSEHFSGKPVIPFCVDVNPGAIPKTLSKIQAMSYSTIGWDKDLIKGIYNILGREPLVDTGSLYGKRKTKLFMIGIITVVIAVAVGITAWILLKPTDAPQDSNTDVSSTSDPTESTTKPLSQKEIYDKASELLEQGKYVEALDLFLQIPDHSNSANMLKKIYSQYEGYYQKDGVTLHLDIADNISAAVEVSIVSDGETTRFSASTTVAGKLIEGSYQDNLQQTGIFTIELENTGVQFSYTNANTSNKLALFFELSEKSDKPIITISGETILSWIRTQHTTPQVIGLGYKLEEFEILDRAGANVIYNIKDTNIYVTRADYMLSDNGFADDSVPDAIVGVQAPAEILIPSYIGKSNYPFIVDDLMYWPNGMLCGEGYLSFGSSPSGEPISADTPIGVTSKAVLTPYMWDELALRIAEITIRDEVKEKNKLESAETTVVARNDTHVLIAVEIGENKCIWYKYDKNSYESIYLREGAYQLDGESISKTLWFSEYLDFAQEFPDLFDVPAGSDAWDSAIQDAIISNVVNLAEEEYPDGLSNYEPYHVVTENDTHILICVHPREIHLYVGAWYKGNKQTGEVVFLRQGPYKEVLYWKWNGNTGIGEDRIAEYLWFKEYSDFANEFPEFYGTPHNEGARYSAQLPYSILFDSEYEGQAVYSGPTYDSDYVGALPEGNNTIVIVEQQYDEDYNFWGKLSTEEGWVCLSSIWEELEREGLVWECNQPE